MGGGLAGGWGVGWRVDGGWAGRRVDGGWAGRRVDGGWAGGWMGGGQAGGWMGGGQAGRWAGKAVQQVECNSHPHVPWINTYLTPDIAMAMVTTLVLYTPSSYNNMQVNKEVL